MSSKRKLLIVFLILIFSYLPISARDKYNDDTDYSRLPASEIHKILGEGKARQLEKARQFAASLPKSTPAYDQTEFDVNYYRIGLRVDIPSEIIYGVVTMEAKSNIDGLDSVAIDLYPTMVVDSVYNASGLLGYYHLQTVNVELDRLYDSGETFSVTISYSGHPTGSGLDGFSFDVYNGNPVAASLSEPYAARSWWPCKDRPDDKADSLDIFVTCDTAYYCASNGNLIDTAQNGDGTRTFNYEVRYPITTYLFSVAISKYTVWYDWYHYGDNDSMIIVNHVYPDKYATSLSSYGIAPEAIGIYASLFGEYPFVNEKYGHANFEWSGAMEHQTVSSMGGGNFAFTIPVIVHELSHQWWGDMITCNNWHEIWLNEGFASYCEALYYEALDGVSAYHTYMASMAYTAGGTIYIYDTTNVYNIFSSRVYDKGAWVLHMLRHVVGDSTFFECLQAYYNSVHQYSDATTEDFKNICESVSGMDLDYFFDEWIYGEYYPRYYWSYNSQLDPTDSSYWNYIRIIQTQGTSPLVFTMPIDLVFTSNSGVDTSVIFNDVGDSIYIIKTDDYPVDIEFDPDSWILRYRQQTSWIYSLIPFPLDSGIQLISYLDSVVARGGSNQHYFGLVSGSLPTGLELDTLTGHISGIPYDTGLFEFEVYATDRYSSSADTADYKIYIEEGNAMAGDVNDDDVVNIFDITGLIGYLYLEGSPPPIPVQADPNHDCIINIFDITYLIDFLYLEGPAPQIGCATL